MIHDKKIRGYEDDKEITRQLHNSEVIIKEAENKKEVKKNEKESGIKT